jgi:hypothetical protein
MAAGLSQTLWSMEDVVALIYARAEAPKPRGPYKTKNAGGAPDARPSGDTFRPGRVGKNAGMHSQ